MKTKVLTIGNPAGNELPNPRINVRGVIFNPKTNKFCFVVMDDNVPFLVGGGTDGEDLVVALKREIIEELGYTDFEIKQQLGGEIISYLDSPKATHRFVSDTGFLVLVNSHRQIITEHSEEEKARNLRHIWLTKQEVLQIWSSVDKLGYVRHKELFRRALEYDSL